MRVDVFGLRPPRTVLIERGEQCELQLVTCSPSLVEHDKGVARIA